MSYDESDYTIDTNSWMRTSTTSPWTNGAQTITTVPAVVQSKTKDDGLTRDQRVKNKMKLIEALGDEVAKLKARPDEPEENGDVVRFTKSYGGDKIYDFAAIKAGDGYWYVTGATSPQRLTWDRLLDFIDEDELQISKAEKWKILK